MGEFLILCSTSSIHGSHTIRNCLQIMNRVIIESFPYYRSTRNFLLLNTSPMCLPVTKILSSLYCQGEHSNRKGERSAQEGDGCKSSRCRWQPLSCFQGQRGERHHAWENQGKQFCILMVAAASDLLT